MRYVLGLIILILAFALLSLPRAYAQSGGNYSLPWWTMDGGGYAFSTGGGYSLGGTAGQIDAGTLGGGGYTLTGGFWGGLGPSAAPGGSRVYLPVVLK